MLCALCVGQASALEYTMEAPDDYLFGRPTSDDTIYEWEDPNVDRSKNTALIPPGFGTPTSYLPGSGDPLTPNLIPGALDGGGLVSQTGSVNYPVIDTGNGGSSGQNVGYTAVTSDLYYSGGHLGTLKIPAIGLSTKVYEGTDSSTLAKGAGHFPGTSIWDGNCCIAGHNRGVRDDFGDLHTLEPGDTITPISWNEAQPGDLVFYPGDEHVGIVGGRDESGNLLIIHCAFSQNNVVITGLEGFTSVGRPLYYGE